MRTMKKGFTLVEIMLFLAITSLLFVGIIVGTNNSIAQQRFTDSVQNFTEFLRSLYSEVTNPQSVGDGRADVAIYGKLITFGESYGLDGTRIKDGFEQRIFVYDIVGDADYAGSGTVAKVLGEMNANVVVPTAYDELGNVIKMGPAGEVRDYVLRWGASLESTEQKDELNPKNNLFKGSMMIVRHPHTGTVNTLYNPITTIQVNQVLNTANTSGNFNNAQRLLSRNLNAFKTQEIDFCINPNGAEVASQIRRDVRLIKNARNVSGIELVDLDLDEVRNDEQIGNRCRFSN